MNKVKVAVFPCGSEVGLEIHRSLKYYRHFELYGFSSINDHGSISFDNYVGGLPFTNAPQFLEILKGQLEELSIDFIIPAMDEVGYLLKENEHFLGCEVVYPDLEIAKVIRKKSETYKALKEVINVPDTFDLTSAKKNLPVFIKPDIGYGSRNARVISEKAGFADIEGNIDEYIISENLPGEEFTIDCFTDHNGNLAFCGARKRERIRMGISVATSSAKNQDRFRVIASKISDALQMKGVWFFQLKEDKDNELKLLEVAGRVAGSMAYYRGLGINFIAAELFQRLGYPIHFAVNDFEHSMLERSFDCVITANHDFSGIYCDLDDCLILEGEKVNTVLVSFLYQAFNKGKKLVLITRHKLDPIQTLRKFRLDSLFDRIIHITDENKRKSDFIEQSDYIFIDDSFRERLDVQKAHGLKVFAPDSIPLFIQKNEF